MAIDLTANCISQFRMNDNAASTVVVDSQGFSNATAQRNTNLFASTGKTNGALDFNGSSDYLNANTDFASVFTDSFSISLWIKTDTVDASTHDICGQYTDTVATYDQCCLYHIGSFGLYFTYNVAGAAGIGMNDFTLTLGGWTHVIITVTNNGGSNATGRMYANNVLIDSDTSAAMDMSGWGGNVGDFLIGQCDADTAGPIGGFEFDGKIDNVMIFDKVLSTAERAFLYNNGGGTESLAGGNGANAALMSCFLGEDI